MSVCPSAWNNPAPRWTYFRELQYFCRFWKFVQKIRGSLKSDKNNGYYTRWPVHVYNVLLNSSSNEKCFRESCRENQNTHFMFNVQGEHKFFPYYKHLLQENYVEYKLFFFQNVTQLKKFVYNTLVHFNMCSFCCTENVCSIISFSPRVLQLVFSYCSKGVCYFLPSNL